ncbi:MAG: hypothetical protein Q7T48_03170 [Cellvibrio sp.]|uniref:hypothetical protein n=1 Tax=Cellvibrio sp. TaxID=1965322 RepID=UPI0027192640|nr:hypothetical protein [Cellvibrio sp.]
MKRVNWFLCSVLFILSCVAQAQAATSDLSSRLQAELDTYKQEIATLRGEALIKSADLITGSGLSDPALYSVVEAKTKSLISEHEAKPKDNVVADELNSLIRALGSMSKNSRDLIIGLVESSSSRGIRNRAHRLHPKLDWFAQRNNIMQKADSYQPGQDLMTHRYLNLLADSDYTFGRWALEELDRRGGAEPIVYKKMGEILARDKFAIKNAVHLDYLAWICKLLSRYDATNSAELLKSIQNDPSKDKYMKKLKKYVKI